MARIRHFSFIIVTLMCISGCSKSRHSIDHRDIDNFSDIEFTDEYAITSLPYTVTATEPYMADNIVEYFQIGGSVNHNHILYIAGSANISPISDENLSLFLTDDEQQSLFQSPEVDSISNTLTHRKSYYPDGKVVTEDYVLLILRIHNL